MTPVLTSAQMREADRRAIADLGIPGPVLMENAAAGACTVLERMLGSLRGRRIAVVCGKGNNGGDGLTLARHAHAAGAVVECLLIAPAAELTGDAALQHAIVAAYMPEALISWSRFNEEIEAGRRGRYDAVVDAILGTGAGGELRGLHAEATAWINDTAAPVLAIDIPTGLDSNTGVAGTITVRAAATATMAALKPGLLLNDGPDHAGTVTVIPIGTPPHLYADAPTRLIDAEDISTLLPAVDRTRHKYDRGRILVCAGSRGMTGAALMTATAAVRTGCGLTVLALPESARGSAIPPEIMTRYLVSGEEGAFAADALASLGDEIDSFDAVAIGPGLSRAPGAAGFVRDLIARTADPVVLDADGLNAYAGNAEALAGRKSDMVITPHYGELARLTGSTKEIIASDPLSAARDAARTIDGIVVLKGAPTVVASPDGRVRINPTGNPGMATGGTGDVLTGMIVSLLAQLGKTPDAALNAALAAVYLHGLAADLAVAAGSVRSMIATDIIAHIPAAYRSLTSA